MTLHIAYFFKRATKSPFYLHVGAELLDSLNRNVRTECGFATLHSVTDRSLEDRMESFFLAETVKYLYVSAILRIFKRRLSEKITVK